MCKFLCINLFSFSRQTQGLYCPPLIPGEFPEFPKIPENEIWLGNHLKSHSHACGIQMGINSHEIIPGILGRE